jgi:hypothetical protein
MRVAVGAGAGFLLSVLWFDLMFDVQVIGHHELELPADIRDSIAAYYRRVTTTARPMNRLVAVAMLVTLGSLIGELARRNVATWIGYVSLALAALAIGLAGARTVRNAVRLGAQIDPAERQSALARMILRDHILCFTAIACTLILQVVVAR